MEAKISRGLIRCSSSHPKPMRSIAPGPKFSARMSKRGSSSVKIRLPSADFMFRVMLRLLQLSIVK